MRSTNLLTYLLLNVWAAFIATGPKQPIAWIWLADTVIMPGGAGYQKATARQTSREAAQRSQLTPDAFLVQVK